MARKTRTENAGIPLDLIEVGGIRKKTRVNDVRVLTDFEIKSLLLEAEKTRYPVRNRAIVLLATDAGLTPSEISYVKRRHLCDAEGGICEEIDLRSKPSIYLRPRIIPMPRNGRLWKAMYSLMENVPAVLDDPLIISERATPGGKATKKPGSKHLRAMRATSISYVFWKLMDKAGIASASARSARTTFIVKAGEKAAEKNISLRNVQELTGQRSLESVQRILEVSEEQKKVIIQDLFEE